MKKEYQKVIEISIATEKENDIKKMKKKQMKVILIQCLIM